MKLSEMNTEQLADCLVGLVEPIGNIAEDPEVGAAITELGKELNGDTPVAQQVGIMAKRLIPLALKTHRKDLFKALSILTGKTEKQIREQRGMETIKEAVSVVDQDLLDFFKSSAPADENRPPEK
jgi:hypothetical protein